MFLNLFLLFMFFHVSHCQRRIINGSEVSEDKTYVVYLVKAPFSTKIYDSWLCGGALVSKEFIITSAACVQDVDYLYAIAGYRKYIKDKFIEYDDCTKTMKKKVIYTCVPVAYEFSYDEIEKWSYIDIALAKVESPYNLFDARFQIMCSYIPTIARINFDPKHQVPGTEAMVLGWGHTTMWREHGDKVNYNQEMLRYTATLLMDKKLCKDQYKDYPELLKTIDKYMLCSLDAGHMNDKGEIISHNHTLVDGCITKEKKLMGIEGEVCQMDTKINEPTLVDYVNYPKDETRKRMNTNDSIEDENIKNLNESLTDENKRNFKFNKTFVKETMEYRISRRNGICQNDHGGPLIGWIGKREVVIGVASVFKIDEENRCVGPYLYTSTVCNSAFLHCTLHEEPPRAPIPKKKEPAAERRALCDSPPSVRGYDTIERFVSWKDHPSGPADNEKALLRSKPVRKEDKFATRVESDKESNDNNPLRDRNTQQVSFPKGFSGKYKAQANFLALMKQQQKSSETKMESSEEKEIEEPLNSSSEEVVSSTDASPTMNDPLDTDPSPNTESSSNLGPVPEAGPQTNLGPPQQMGPDIGSTSQMQPSNLQSLPEMRPFQPDMGFPPQMVSPLEIRQNPWQLQSLGTSQNLGSPPNLGPPPNFEPSPNRPLQNQGYSQNQRLPLYLGSQQNLRPPQNLGPPPSLGPIQNLGPPQNLGPYQNLGLPQNLGSPPNLAPSQNFGPPQNLGLPQNLGPPPNMAPPQNFGPPKNQGTLQNLSPPQNVRFPQNLGHPPNLNRPQNLGYPPYQEFQQNLGLQQNLGPTSNLRPSPNPGFQQNLVPSSNQGFQQNLGSPQNLRPPQNLGISLNLRPTANLVPQSNFKPILNSAPSSYSELLKSYDSPTNLGPSGNMGSLVNFKSSLNQDPSSFGVPNMRSPTFEPPSRTGAPPKEGFNTEKNQNQPISQNNTNAFTNFKMRPLKPIRSK